MEYNEIEGLNPLQTFLLVLVKFGLTTPYDLLSKAKLGAGLTSPVLKRLERAGLLSSTPGPRNRLRYVITGRGEEVLSRNLMLGQTHFWRHGKTDIFESLPRGIVLAWLHAGPEEALRGVERAASKLLLLSQSKEREAGELRGFMHSLQADISSNNPAADEGMLIATAYQWIKAESDAALFRLQAEAIRKISPLMADLPAAPKIR
jgi:DNA-binding PadR family transcriptional regulator